MQFNDVNKTSTSVDFMAINILRYASQKATDVDLGIKSAVGLKTFVVGWHGHNAFARSLKSDELLQ